MSANDRNLPAVRWFEHQAMACDWGIGIREKTAQSAEAAAQAAFDEIDRLEAELSRFRSDSDIARLNRLRPGERLTVGPALLECLTIAARVHDATAGAFDIGVGALLPLGGAAQLQGAPCEKTIGMRCLRVDAARRQVWVSSAGVVFDLGAIGKGYAADCAAAVIQEWGISAAIVHAGQSSIRAFGDCAWPVAVRDPREDRRKLADLSLRNGSLGGSGVRVRGAHIVDARTGEPVAGVDGAWALAADAAYADAVSTAMMVMSAEEIDRFFASNPGIGGMRATSADSELQLRRWGTWL